MAAGRVGPAGRLPSEAELVLQFGVHITIARARAHWQDSSIGAPARDMSGRLARQAGRWRSAL
jgi:hypothetical protein